jgi:thioredoxin 1
MTMSDIIEVTDQNFEAEVLQSDKPAIIDFWAEWCAPCRQIAPIIKELAGTYGDKVKIVKMDIDANPATPGRFGVRAIPTILAFKDGQVVQQITGARPKADFEGMVKDLIG